MKRTTVLVVLAAAADRGLPLTPERGVVRLALAEPRRVVR